jgi:hypothetical protein
MLDIRRSGPSLAEFAADMRDLPARVFPYAAATALTKSAKRGQAAVIESMRTSFDRPVAYTLNATRIEVATKDKLSARIAVKDQAGGGSGRPTSYLLPEVEGGARSEKGIERALRYAGILRSSERVVPGAGAKLDASGNVSAAITRSILRQVTRQGAAQRRSNGAIFAAALGRKRTRGIWQREGKQVKALFIFTTRIPTYRPRLDFVGAAATAVRDGFASDFYAAAQSLKRKF